jgi:hypothetical protein
MTLLSNIVVGLEMHRIFAPGVGIRRSLILNHGYSGNQCYFCDVSLRPKKIAEVAGVQSLNFLTKIFMCGIVCL